RCKRASVAHAKYGAQTGNDAQWFPDAGNGVLKSTGQDVAGNDPSDADVPNTVGIEQAWAQHLVTTWGTAANGGLKYYILDNEHSIWHSTHRYVHPTWINDTVKLIPRIKGWVATYYPGLPTAITEYNWGAESHINGATTQADILGIFGREGLDIGTRWTTPDPTTPTYKAMKMYRNYDVQKSTFGDTSVAATGPNPDNVAAFAAVR